MFNADGCLNVTFSAVLTWHRENHVVAQMRKLLILDLDNTLIYCRLARPNESYPNVPSPDIQIVQVPVNDPFVNSPYAMYMRPGICAFLQAVAQWYDLAIYSAAVSLYGNVVVDRICDTCKVNISLRHWRDECVPIAAADGLAFTKDILMVAREWNPMIHDSELLANVVLVDDKPCSLMMFPRNGVLVTRYEGQRDDKLLPKLQAFLQEVCMLDDVRRRVKGK